MALIVDSNSAGPVPDVTVVSDITTPGSLESYATVHSIGFEWEITGDDNHDAACTVQYRVIGDAAFKEAMPLYRVDYEGYNTMAGSIFFLDPGSTYEIELTLIDPDGGDSTVFDTVITKSIPVVPTSGNVFHVVPGNGGGDGSVGTPFLGVDAAEAIAQAGDIMLLHAGNYGGTIYFNSGGASGNHVLWTAYGDGDPIFNGIRIEADYIWFDGLKIVNQQYGLRTSPPGPKGIVVTRCFFENNHYGIFLNDGGSGWYIADNTIVGDNEPGSSDLSGEGIELQHTSDHTVAHNAISRTADGISYPHKNVDMFGNEIFDLTDDGIEFDYGHANNRAWKNRITNAFNNGISFQPQDGAPYYVIYNQVSVLNSQSVLKLRDRSDRALVAHNTFVCNSGPMSFGSQYLIDFEIKNNLWISINDRYAWENGSISGATWKTDFDYDGFDWGDYPYAFKWGARMDDIQELYDSTAQELHGIEIDHTACIDSIEYSGSVDSFYIRYYILADSCDAVDAGIALFNINNGFSGSAPDLGAYEQEKDLPHYGVRDICYTTKVNIWIGPSVGNWYGDPAYWSLGRFPDTCDKVDVSPGVAITVLAGETAFCNMLDLDTTAELRVMSHGELIVKNR